jgi:hypothetical protein
MPGFFSRLLHLGPTPESLREHLGSESIIARFEHVRVRYRFSGRVPGLVSLLDRSSFSGALIFTGARVFSTISQTAGPLLDVPWTKGADGSAQVSIDQTGVHVVIDLQRVDPDFSGSQSFDYRQPLTPELLAQLPKLNLGFDIPRESVLRLAGVPVRNAKTPPTA